MHECCSHANIKDFSYKKITLSYKSLLNNGYYSADPTDLSKITVECYASVIVLVVGTLRRASKQMILDF